MAKAPSPLALALPKLDLEERTLDVRLKLKGKAVQDLLDYQRAYQAAHGVKFEPDALAMHVLNAFFEGDKGFQTWRRANPAAEGQG